MVQLTLAPLPCCTFPSLENMADLFSFGFGRPRQINENDDVQEEPGGASSSSSSNPQVQASTESERPMVGRSTEGSSAKKRRKNGSEKIATIKKWQMQVKDKTNSGFKPKRPDLTWIRYEKLKTNKLKLKKHQIV